MLTTALLVVLARLDTCSACLVRGQEVVLCAPHAAEDRDVTTREAKRLRSGADHEQLAALDAVAALTRAHENAPSPRVVKVLAGGLEDESLSVRKRAAELLGPPQHAPDAMRALLGALGEVDQVIAKVDEELRRHRKVGEPTSDKRTEEYWEELDRSLLAKRKAMDCLDHLYAALDWRGILVGQLAAFPDDRVVVGILRSEKVLATDDGLRSLLALGNRLAVEAALAALAQWQDSPPSSGEEAAHARRGRLLLEGLEALAEKHGLPHPSRSARPHAEWLAWWNQHAEAVPASLPGVRSPAW